MQEKRKYVRVVPDEEAPIEVQIIGADFIDILQARNISEGGLKVEVPHLFAGCDIGKPVQLIVSLPSTRSFKTQGQIKHTVGGTHPAFGVKFLDLAQEAHRAVVAYVNERVAAGATS